MPAHDHRRNAMPTARREALIGFHASHEQQAPEDLLAAVRHAADRGFDSVMCSDHLAPWTERQGHSANAWVWLGAATQACDVPVGVVTAPGQRYHPAVTAQAIATLARLAPGRCWIALGSGEAVNEHVTGDPWPDKAERVERLLESVDVIRRLLCGEEVTHDGHVTVDRARLWTLPQSPPPLLAAAISPETAMLAGTWADGLITVNQPTDTLRKVIAGFRDAGGEDRPVYEQMPVAWAASDELAQRHAVDRWPQAGLPSPNLADLCLPADFDDATADIGADDLADAIVMSADTEQHIERIREVVAAGADGVFLHQVGPDQHGFIEHFGRHVLPAARATG